jgi:ornithine decarboxylase
MAPSATTVIEQHASFTSIESILEKTHYLEYNGVNTPKGLVGNALKTRVESIDHVACEPGEEDSFFVADLGEVYRQHMRWKLNLPRVKPFYGKFIHSKMIYMLLIQCSGQVQPGHSSYPPSGRTWHWI